MAKRTNVAECCEVRAEVLDSRPTEGVIRRRRECPVCKARWTTYEVDESTVEIVFPSPLGPVLHARLLEFSPSAREALRMFLQAMAPENS